MGPADEIGHFANLGAKRHLQHRAADGEVQAHREPPVEAADGLPGQQSPVGAEKGEQQNADDGQRHQHVDRDHPRLKVRAHDPGAEPALERHHRKRGQRSPGDPVVEMAQRPGKERREQDEQPDGDADEPVEVLGPSFDGVETGFGIAEVGVDFLVVGRQLRLARWRNPAPEAGGPVRAAHAGTRGAHRGANQNEEIHRGNGDQHHFAVAL